MSTSPSLVSIIIPCYNAASWLQETVQSCLAQSYRPIEIIIIDDGSTDESLEIIRSLHSQFPDIVRYEVCSNQGGSAARNRGFALSHGEYIQWLDADDLLAPQKLQLQASALASGKFDLVSGRWRHLHEQVPGRFVAGPLKQPVLTTDPVADMISAEGWAPPAAYLMTRDIIEQVDGWDENLRCLQDVDLTLRIAMAGGRFALVPQLTAWYRRPVRVTVSTRDRQAFKQACFDNYVRVLNFAESQGWTEQRRQVLLRSLSMLIRLSVGQDRRMFENSLRLIAEIDPQYVPEGTLMLRALVQLFGYQRAEHIALRYRQIRSMTQPRRRLV